METEVDVLEFQVPMESNKALFVWNIPPCFSQAHIYDSLSSIFSSFGPLFLLRVLPSSPPNAPGFSALIRFYSALQTSHAQRATDGLALVQDGPPLKVRLSTRGRPSFLLADRKPLGHARCVELANQCLGFNGWSTHIVTLKQLDANNPEEEEEEEEQRRSRGGEEGHKEKTLRYGCVVHLSFTQHQATSRGVAVVEERFTNTGPAVCIQKHSKLQRWVRDKAVADAFSSVLLVLLGDGRLMVEVRQGREHLLPADDMEGVISVNKVSWSEFDPEEEDGDEEWELSVT